MSPWSKYQTKLKARRLQLFSVTHLLLSDLSLIARESDGIVVNYVMGILEELAEEVKTAQSKDRKDDNTD